MVRRLASFALLAAATTGGCAASRVGQMPQLDPVAERPAPPASPRIAEIVNRHNRNAELVTSLQASPSVSAKMSRIGAGARGNMVFERPHNFRFIVESGFSGKQEADIGSNEEEFWFWANDKKDHNVYVCRYDAPATSSGNELAFQPDWIVEALGLREIPEAEMRKIQVANVKDRPGTLAWIHARTTLRGEPVKKITVLDRNGQILEHQFFMPGSKSPVAVASPTGSRSAPLVDEPGRTVLVPEKIHLRLAAADPKQAPIEMDLVLNSLKVNAPIAQAKREDLFSIPQIANSTITRLDEPGDRSRPQPRQDASAIRTETRQSPAPPPAGEGVRLEEPAPIDIDGAHLRRTDPMPLEPDLGGPVVEGSAAVVGAPMPQPPETPADRVARESAPFPR